MDLGVSMDVRVDTGGLGSMIRGGTGELLQMAFGGQGYVLVQPSESVTEGGHQSGGKGRRHARGLPRRLTPSLRCRNLR